MSYILLYTTTKYMYFQFRVNNYMYVYVIVCIKFKTECTHLFVCLFAKQIKNQFCTIFLAGYLRR